MVMRDIIIRNKEQLGSMHEIIRKALLDEAKRKDKRVFPVVYTYLGKKHAFSNNEITPENTIGELSNIHLSEDGDVVGDISILDVHSLSINFVGVIDNIVVGVEKDSNIKGYHMINAVVYDKFAKAVIDEKRSSERSANVIKLQDSPVADKTAQDKSMNPLQNPEVMASIEKSMKEEFKDE